MIPITSTAFEVSPMKYVGYEIAQVATIKCSTGTDTIPITDPDTLSELRGEVIETFFTLYGRFRDGKLLLADAICDSTDFDRVLQVYSRITGNQATLSPPAGYLIQLPA